MNTCCQAGACEAYWARTGGGHQTAQRPEGDSWGMASITCVATHVVQVAAAAVEAAAVVGTVADAGTENTTVETAN